MIASDWTQDLKNDSTDNTSKVRNSHVESIAKLRQKHLYELQKGSNWVDVWEMFVNDTKFNQILDIAVFKCVRNFGLPAEWKEDLRQETLVYFARQIQKSTELGFDSTKGSFEGWLYTLLFGNCRKATRQFRDSQRQKCDRFERFSSSSWVKNTDLKLDLSELIENLEEQQRDVFLKYWEGVPVGEIANQLSIGERKAYRILKKAIDQVKNLIETN